MLLDYERSVADERSEVSVASEFSETRSEAKC